MKLNPPLAIGFVCRGRRMITTPTSRMEDKILVTKKMKKKKMIGY